MINLDSVRVVQDMELALGVLKRVGQWMLDSGMNPSKWWHPDNMTQEFFSEYAEPEEFFVALVDNYPAAAQIIQWDQRNQDWSGIDKGEPPLAVYVHWLCVDHKFSGEGLPNIMIGFAEDLAKSRGINLVRIDTNATELKLRRVYESLGFELVGTQGEGYRTTAFYQKSC